MEDDDFGAQVRNWRKSKGWNQKEASAELEIDQSYLSKIERGTRAPSFQLLERLERLGGPHIAFDSHETSVAEARASFNRTFVLPAPENVVIHRALTFPGDTFLYDRDVDPTDGDFVVVAMAGEPQRTGKVANHPMENELFVWFTAGEHMPLAEVTIVATAIEWRRPIKQP